MKKNIYFLLIAFLAFTFTAEAAGPSRFPSGVTNVKSTQTMGDMGQLDPTQFHTFFEDFDATLVGYTATAISAGAGTSALSYLDADGGVGRITTAANASDGLAVEGPAELFLVEAGKQLFMKVRAKVGDAIYSTMMFGLHSTDTTPLDAAMRFAFTSDNTTAAIYFNSDDNTTDADSGTVATLADDTWVTLGLHYDGKGSIDLYTNDVQTMSMSDVDVPGAEMAIGFAYWNGASGAETTDIDYIFVAKQR